MPTVASPKGCAEIVYNHLPDRNRAPWMMHDVVCDPGGHRDRDVFVLRYRGDLILLQPRECDAVFQ